MACVKFQIKYENDEQAACNKLNNQPRDSLETARGR